MNLSLKHIKSERRAFTAGQVVSKCVFQFDKLEFVDLSDFILQNMNDLQTVAFVPLAYDPVANRNDSEQKLKEVKI